jgi:hypothetical protein
MMNAPLKFEVLWRFRLNQPSTRTVLSTAGMEQQFTDAAEETLLQTLRRRYAYLSAWLLRLNRAPEPARPPDPVRPLAPPRMHIPPRQPQPPRPE